MSRMLLLLLLALAAPAATAQSFDRLVVFGTSLSDPGNAFVLLGSNSVPPDYSVDPFLVPDRPYARGGHHFSNGPTWIEQLARALGMGQSAQPAMGSNNKFATNYAVGSARARDDGKNFNLEDQVLRFLHDSGWLAPSSALYVMEMGANDVRDALVIAAGGGDPSPVVGAAITATVNNMALLYSRGARRFLVWTVPNVGITPAVRSIPDAASAAAQLASFFNANLDAALAQLSGTLPGLHIARLDVNPILKNVVESPQSFGLRNAASACITPNVPPFVCRKPDELLFWDGIHPTSAAHGSRAALEAISNSPVSHW